MEKASGLAQKQVRTLRFDFEERAGLTLLPKIVGLDLVGAPRGMVSCKVLGEGQRQDGL